MPRAPEPEETWGQTRLSASVSASRKIESDPAFPPAPRRPEGSPAPDSRYYLAQELDSYPGPLSPLRFGRPAGGSPEDVLLEILIDERGIVRDVIFTRPAQPGQAEEELRALLVATRFLPARRDGRVVRSRLTLRVKLEPKDSER